MKRRINFFLLLFSGFTTLLFCTAWSHKGPTLKTGYWRSVIQRPDGNEIVFTFQTRDSAGKKVLYIINGSEKLLVDDIHFQDDSVYITLPFFESSFHAAFDEKGNMNGYWIKKLGDREQVLPFKAAYNQNYRFLPTKKPLYNITGNWAVQFFSKNNQRTDAIGAFDQKGNYLTGTFLTSTGDYRFLEGMVNGDSLYLSGFDGGHAYMFTAKVNDPGHLSSGRFYSGPLSIENWSGYKDENAKLPDGYDQTHLKQGESGLKFTFKSTDGKNISLDDPRYRNKVIVIQLMGSWCPNCMDET
ncbi:MAG TPA: TlpA family protein disulfide reductase, partial [Flavisolibacter sp.]|nr:TlpA family protein disulfide reductase [Flavisolibacter sp.]